MIRKKNKIKLHQNRDSIQTFNQMNVFLLHWYSVNLPVEL
jgi:hypothetical protein